MEAHEVADLISLLRDLAQDVARGEYGKAQALFDLTKEDKYPAVIRELAEAFGMMLVQIEGRQYRLEQTIDELAAKNQELEATLAKVRVLENRLRHEAFSLRQLCNWMGLVLLVFGLLIIGGAVFAHLAVALPLRDLLTTPGMLIGVVTLLAGTFLVGSARGWSIAGTGSSPTTP